MPRKCKECKQEGHDRRNCPILMVPRTPKKLYKVNDLGIKEIEYVDNNNDNSNLLETDDCYVVGDNKNKLKLIIRKPQEGKTFICISSIIQDKTSDKHLVFTMNTLSAGMQFFGRMEEEIGSKRIVVFNSDPSTAGNCHHAKDLGELLEVLRNNDIKVVVMCAHVVRICKDIPIFLKTVADSLSYKEKGIQIRIHIDEAHKYIPSNRRYIREWNNNKIVKEITGYTATPKGIYMDDVNDPIFYKPYIIDTIIELGIIKSLLYFGVCHCSFEVYDNEYYRGIIMGNDLDPNIPRTILDRSDYTGNHKEWYQEDFPFILGNETKLLKYIKYIVPSLKLDNNKFSYNFIPGYTRKATHYQIVDIVLETYDNANVLVLNGSGNGFELYRIDNVSNQSKLISTSMHIIPRNKEEEKLLLEPAYQIQKLIEKTKDCPTFITGFYCVGMSVTLISKELGNFDNVIFAHDHYKEDILYQLCRFVFNYSSWSEEEQKKIKETKLHIFKKEVIDTIQNYENWVERLANDFAGQSPSIHEIEGTEPELPSKRKLKSQDLYSVELLHDTLWKKFKVYDSNDDEMWNKAEEFYKENTGHKLAGKSKPKKNDVGFYKCSDTGKLGVKSKSEIDNLKNQSWYSTFQLVSRKLNYARVFVGYDDLTDNSEYTIYIKYANLEENEHNMNILQKWYNNNKDIKLMIEGQEYIKQKAPGDGNCFFHATALYLGKSQDELRKEVSKYMLENKEDFIESYEQDEHDGKTYEEFVKKIEITSEWADNLVIQAMQKLYNRTIKIYEEYDSELKQIEGVSEVFRDEPICLLYNGTDHYDALIKPS